MSRGPIGVCSALVALLAALAFTGVASARTFRVNKTADHAPGACNRADCTLREAVIAANARTGPDTILLRGGKVYGLALAGAGENFAATGDLDAIDPLTIKPAPPRRGRRARRATIDANGLDRVLDALDALSISRLVVREGDASLPAEEGGAIRSDGAPLKVTGSVLRGNRSDDEGGAIDIDDATLTGGRLTILRSVLTANTSESGGGGAVSADEVFTVIRRSTLSSNQSTAAVGGGLRQFGGTLEITSSTVSRNVADTTSGGIRFSGLPSAVMTLTNVTIEGNRANGDGGGIRISDGTAFLTSVTIIRNTGGADGGTDEGGGLQEDSLSPVTVKSSIIALNTIGAGTGPDCFSDTGLVSGGHNLLGSTDPACTGFTGTGDFISGTPMLGALRNNGGPTKTACPQKGSPAINKGAPDAPPRDQRGRKRVGQPDVGACERTPRKRRHRRR